MKTKSCHLLQYGMNIMTGVLAVSALSILGAPQVAMADGAVKIECQGNCANVNLGQACDKFSVNSVPVAIACDDTAKPGAGTSSPCGVGGAACTQFGALVRGDLVSAYCSDGGGNDAVVTCR